MEDRAAELEAMGGDPFFLMEDDDDNDDEKETGNDGTDDPSSPALTAEFLMAAASLSTDSPVARFVTDGLGPSPKMKPASATADPEKREDDDWEWDGTINEDAHLDLDEW
jgi:hypothetical protein